MQKQNMKMRRSLVYAGILMLGLSACGGYSLVPVGTLAVANKQLIVAPVDTWNRVVSGVSSYALRKAPGSEYWTADGDMLNLLSFHSGLAEGATLFKAVDKKERPMPAFRSSMTLAEIPEWVESSMRLRSANATNQMGEVKPLTFSGQPGVQFDLTYVDETEVPRKARGAATVKDGKLYLILFEGVTPVYFNRRIEEVDRIIAAASIKA
jgi:hypothetical protein